MYCICKCLPFHTVTSLLSSWFKPDIECPITNQNQENTSLIIYIFSKSKGQGLMLRLGLIITIILKCYRSSIFRLKFDIMHDLFYSLTSLFSGFIGINCDFFPALPYCSPFQFRIWSYFLVHISYFLVHTGFILLSSFVVFFCTKE